MSGTSHINLDSVLATLKKTIEETIELCKNSNAADGKNKSVISVPQQVHLIP